MTDSYAPTSLPSQCNLCQKFNNPCVNLQNDHRRTLAVSEITRTPSWNIRQILSCICSRCLLFIESLTESSNLLRLSCTNALSRQNAAQPTPLTAYPSANSSELHQTLTPSPDIGANYVVLSPQAATAAVVATEPSHPKDVGHGSSIRTPSAQDDVLSLLEVHHELNVSPLATESAGAVNRTSTNWHSRLPTAEGECLHCKRSFKGKNYMKHYYRCRNAVKMRYCRSLRNTGRLSIYQDDVASIASESSKENRLLEIQAKPPCFRCSKCTATFKFLLELKEHTFFVHQNQLKCDICGHYSTTQYQYDFHRAECIAKLEVSRENENTAGKQRLPARRKTRSYSVYVSVAAEQQSKDSVMDMTNCQSTDQIQTAKPKRAKPVTKSDRNLELKEHNFVHRIQLNCDICGHSSTTKYQYDFHRAECIAKLEVSRENENTAGKQRLPARRKTRSYSPYVSVAAEEQSKDLAMDMTHGQSSKQNQTVKPKAAKTVTKSNRNLKIKEHNFVHRIQLNCDICGHSSTTQYQFDFHRAECIAKLEVSRENENTARKRQFPTRRKTRSYSPYVSVAAEEQSKDLAMNMTHGQSSKQNQTVKPKRAKTVTKSVRKRSSEQFDESTLSETRPTPAALHYCPLCPVIFESKFQLMGHMRVHTKLFNCYNCRHKYRTQLELDLHRTKCIRIARRMTRLYSKNISDIELISTTESKSKDSVSQYPYVEDDGNDDVSVADSIYLRRLSYTNRWLDTHNNQTSHSRVSQCDGTFIKQIINVNETFIKECSKDLKLLDRLKHEVMLKRITCYEPKCCYVTTSLNDMMRHDYMCHFKKPWYSCHKCGNRFTSKVFLDYHLDIQDKGHNYLCHKCDTYFPRRHELHRHLLQHVQQSADEIEIERRTCFWCNLVFRDEDSLSKHCADTGHNSRETRQLIHIEYSKTFRYVVPLRDTITYSEKVIQMHTVPLPRQSNIPFAKKRPRPIGTVEFKDPSIANCVGLLKGH